MLLKDVFPIYRIWMVGGEADARGTVKLHFQALSDFWGCFLFLIPFQNFVLVANTCWQ